MALCCHQCMCLLYRVLLCYFCLPKFLDLLCYWVVLIAINWIYIHLVNAAFLYTALRCLVFHYIHSFGSFASTHSPEVTNLATVCTHLPISQALSWWMAGAAIMGIFTCADGFLGVYLGVPFIIFSLSNSLVSLQQTGLFGLLFFLPNIITSHLLSMCFPHLWWTS